MELHEIKNKLQSSLTNLYQLDKTLFERNKGRGVCERSLVFRFAYYLQNSLPDYYVDCDFNSSAIIKIDDTGYARVTEQNGKQILNTDGIKIGMEKDENNLIKLTSDFGYKFGLPLILGKNFESTKISVFHSGYKINDQITINEFING